MTFFHKRTALRIAFVSVALAVLAGPIAWLVSRERDEEAVVAFAMEESRRLLLHFDAATMAGKGDRAKVDAAARALAGGLFDIAEIYDHGGNKLSEALTAAGTHLEAALPHHVRPSYTDVHYDSLTLRGTNGKDWLIRVFVPLRTANGQLAGYFEGVRLVPEWQSKQIFADATTTALMVALASLLCGLTLYPVVVRLLAENERKARAVLESHIAMMEALGRAIAKRDAGTGVHNYRVACIAARLGEAVGVQGEAMQSLIMGSFLHDAGKIAIPDAILLKPGKLDEGEMATMRTHVEQGMDILTGAGWLDGAREVVSGHHEKWNGSGYPGGLAGAAIPLSARIFAIADVFDALCSARPYKAQLPLAEVLQLLRDGAGSHFDPQLLDEFLRLAPEIHATTVGKEEAEVRSMLEGIVKRHFGI